jgi:zinc/manganese transport system substrate-binding protein
MPACVAVLALLTGACGTTGAAEDPDDGALRIAATTTVLGDVVGNVAPAGAEVSVLMEPGADPHTFEPSARQLAELQEADLVVVNGGGLEAGLQPAVDDAQAAGVPVFTALEHVTPLGGEEDTGDDHGEDEHAEDDSSDHDATAASEYGDGHDHGAVDPHFWMDPVRMAEVVADLGARIGELTDGARPSAERAERYGDELGELDGRISDLLDDVPADRRTIVTNHEALSYFADRYDLRVVGTVIPSMTTAAESSARDIEQLAAVMRREGVTTIFAETTAPQQLAETLADDAGGEVEVVVLFTESVGGEDGPATYVDMLMTDAELIRGALRR